LEALLLIGRHADVASGAYRSMVPSFPFDMAIHVNCHFS
jgi:hypothetical protein